MAEPGDWVPSVPAAHLQCLFTGLYSSLSHSPIFLIDFTIFSFSGKTFHFFPLIDRPFQKLAKWSLYRVGKKELQARSHFVNISVKRKVPRLDGAMQAPPSHSAGGRSPRAKGLRPDALSEISPWLVLTSFYVFHLPFVCLYAQKKVSFL